MREEGREGGMKEGGKGGREEGREESGGRVPGCQTQRSRTPLECT